MEPIKLEFIVKGDIEKDLARVKLAIKGVGDESYTSFKRLLGSSNEAFSGLNRTAQLQAVTLQQVIQQLRQNEAAQEALYAKFKQSTISSREYAEAQSRLSVQQAELKRQASELNRAIEREIQLNRVVAGSLQEKKVMLQRLREDYSQLNRAERENEKIGGQLLGRIRELKQELKSVDGGLKEVKTSSGNLTDALEQIPGPIGSGVSQFRQLLSAGKAFMTSGLGIFVAGLTTLFYGLKTAIEGSEEATNKMNATFAYAKSIWTTQKRMLTESAAGIYNLLTGNTDAADKNAIAFRNLQMNQTAYAALSAKAHEEQVRINKTQERNNGLILANSAAIEQYRTQLMDVNKTFEERKKIGQEVLRLEKENANLKLKPIAENYANEFIGDKNTLENITKEFPKQIELANKYFKTLTEGGELTLTQQHELINAVNDITAGLDKGWDDEQKAKFRSYFTDALTVTKEYYSRSREVSTNLSNIIKQQANETAKENKKTALEKLQEEVKTYKEQYEILYAYERNMGKEAADEAFKDLKAKGGDFLVYLNNKIDELQSKPNRTKDEDISLGYLQKTRKEVAPKFDSSDFKNSIAEKKKLYKEDLDGYAEYLERLRKLMEGDTSDFGTQKRIILDLEIKDVKEEQQKKLDELLKNYQGFTLRMTSLEKDYQRDMSRLSEASQKATTEYDKKRYQDAIDARTDAYQVQTASMMAENASFTRVLFGDMEKISSASLKKAITQAKKFISDWKKTVGELTPDMQSLLDKIEQGIKSAEQATSGKMANNLQEIGGFLQDCAGSVSDFNAELADSIDAIGQMASAMGQIASGNYLGAALNVFSTVVASVAKSNQEAIQYAKTTEGYYWDAVNYKIEKQIKLMKELQGISADEVDRTIQQQIDELMNILKGIDLDVALNKNGGLESFTKLVEKAIGQAKEKGNDFAVNFLEGMMNGEKDISGRWKFSFFDVLKDLTQDEILSLQGVAEIWQVLPEEIQKYIQQLQDAVDKQKELEEANKETLTQTTSNAIADTITQGFISGKKGAVDFADDFKDLMRNAMMQAVKVKYLEAPLQEWYTRFADASENGLTADKIEELRRQYDKIIDSASAEAEALEKITGVSLAQDATREAVAKGIASMSQDSANELNGNFSALLIYESKTCESVQNIQSLLYQAAAKWVEIEENTRYCRKLEGMEKDMKGMRSDINQLVNKGIIIRKS